LDGFQAWQCKYNPMVAGCFSFETIGADSAAKGRPEAKIKYTLLTKSPAMTGFFLKVKNSNQPL
jgi:hypothetical protein